MRNKLIIMAALALATLVLGGCASTPWGSGDASTADTAAEIELLKAELARKDEALAQQQLQLDERALLADMENETQSAAPQMSVTGNSSGLTPPDSKPGECYAWRFTYPEYEAFQERVTIKPVEIELEVVPAKYKIVGEHVLVKEAITETIEIPAVYETIQERVLIKPAETKEEFVPAVYETIEESILVKKASTTLKVIPAEYKTVTERELVREAGTVWVPGTSISADSRVLKTRIGDTGELMCLIPIDEVYEDVLKQELVEPATTREVKIPAAYTTIEKEVLVKPATTRTVEISPAIYTTIEKEELVKSATTSTVEISPAEFKTVETRVLTDPEKMQENEIAAKYKMVTRNRKIGEQRSEWVPVLCKDNNTTPKHIEALQAALNEKGFCKCGQNENKQCDVDGLVGSCTLQSVKRFADANGLWSGGNFITMEVISELGLTF